jgi:N-acyl-D-amino-acid deacylase
MNTTVITNGTIIDGTGKKAYVADILVKGERIDSIGRFGKVRADMRIDATGAIVCPGFVDIQNHSDSYWTILEEPSQESLLLQGITTIVGGHCGSSLAPLPTQDALRAIQKWKVLAELNLNWTSFAGFLDQLEHLSPGVNFASLVGHSTLRQGIHADHSHGSLPDDAHVLEHILKQSMHEGAWGMSAGFIYAHEADVSEQEFLLLLKQVSHHHALFSVHLRSEGSHLLPALEETLHLAEKGGTRLKISHFKIRGKQNWHQLHDALHRLESAYQRGVPLRFDVYPYSSTWSVLYTYLPRWVYEEGEEKMLVRLRDEQTRKRVVDYLKHQEYDFSSVVIATSETNPALVGRSLGGLALRAEKSVEETLVDVVLACNAHVVVFDHNLSEELTRELLRHPLSVIASDAAGYPLAGSAATPFLVHPRCFGAFPKFLRLVREEKLLSWEEAVRKASAIPAEFLGLQDRGVIGAHNFADLVILDPNAIRDRATFENPFEAPQGIRFVMVNGEFAVREGEIVGKRAGRILRRN